MPNKYSGIDRAKLIPTSSLLARQITTLEKSFLAEGGFTEKLYRARTAARNSAKRNAKDGPLR